MLIGFNDGPELPRLESAVACPKCGNQKSRVVKSSRGLVSKGIRRGTRRRRRCQSCKEVWSTIELNLEDVLTTDIDHMELITRLQLAVASFQETNLSSMRQVLKATRELEAAAGAIKQENADGI